MTVDKTKSPTKANAAARSVVLNKGAPIESAFARETVAPWVSAAVTLRQLQKPAPDKLTIDALVDELESQAKAVNAGNLARGEAMLTAQAHTLDAIFGHCARRAHLNMGEYPQAADTYMRLALRAQSQCRATWETLAAMKNPPAMFVRQANIAAGPQQVNNGPRPEPSRPREIENTPNKLLEAEHERMDIRAAALAGRSDPQMATVGEIDGAKDGGG